MNTSDHGSIRQWTRDGEPAGKPLDSHEEQMGSMMICGSPDGRLLLWNIKGGSIVGDPWKGHNAAVRCVDWCPNATGIASGSQDGAMQHWNPTTGQQIATPIEIGYGQVLAVRYSPQGDKFASGGEDNFSMISVWSNNGELLIQTKGHEHGVTSLCWPKDGAYIFSASFDCTIRKWQSIDGKEVTAFRAHAFGQGTSQSAFGTSRPMSQLETYSCITMNS